MRVGLNATCFNERPSGAKQRFCGIYNELIRQMPESEFVIYEPADCRVAEWFGGMPNISAKRTPLPSVGRVKKIVRGIGYWNDVLKKENYHIFEGFSLPLFRPQQGHALVTIHDVRRMQGGARVFDRYSFNKVASRAFECSDSIITVSRSMKNELSNLYPGLPVSVVYNGIDAKDFIGISEKSKKYVAKKYNLPNQFILSVGHFEKRKNYSRLIDALAILRDRGCDPGLVIIGNDSGERKNIEAKIVAENLSNQVKLLCELPDADVRCIYALSDLFVFPSSYEGFGIPVLESMAAGCPVILSDIPVFREITENKGRYFSSTSADDMAVAIDELLSSSDARKRTVEYGKNRVMDFSFQSAAKDLKSLYRKLS